MTRTPHFFGVFAVAVAIAMLGLAGPAHGKRARASKPIEARTADGKPNVQAKAAVVMDAATTAELYAKNPDMVRAIASTGKIFVALVVRRRSIDLDGVTEITRLDRDHARGGARTRLSLGHKFRNQDLLRAMLIASDNRAPTALGRAVGLSPDKLVEAMNELARDMGLTHTTFTDPSGLRGNESTPREMALAFREALADPLLRTMMGRADVAISAVNAPTKTIYYRNTNKALHSQRYGVVAGKTGYTTAAGYCLLIAVAGEGREIIMVFLGTQEKLTRYGDFNRAASWLDDGLAPPPSTVLRIADTVHPTSAIIGVTAAGVGTL